MQNPKGFPEIPGNPLGMLLQTHIFINFLSQCNMRYICVTVLQTHIFIVLASNDELAKDLEKFLDQASLGPPAATREAELRFHLINSLPDNVAFQLKPLAILDLAYRGGTA